MPSDCGLMKHVLSRVTLVGLVLLCWLLCLSTGCKQSPCQSDADCASGSVCNEVSSLCVPPCSTSSDCLAGQTCEVGKGKCIPQSCQPQTSKRCEGNILYAYDSCNKRGEMLQDCGAAGCADGACQGDTKTCPNGVCDIFEDCLSCAQDCQCQTGETCEGGVCKAAGTCGNGTCETGVEDCGSCPKDCACQTKQLCEKGVCTASPTCGDGVCDPAQRENCLSCQADCQCPQGQYCDAPQQSCRKSCGNGLCDAQQGETCATCPHDCPCGSNQRCSQGVCSQTCGNGLCETSYGETCGSCPRDCPCGANQSCQNGGCGTSCGNGSCDTAQGENCSTCPKDCGCNNTEVCRSGKCNPQCGNGRCDTDQGETCATCPQDCLCGVGDYCRAGACVARCGDGTCDPNQGETCSTCPNDCGCPSGQVCKAGSCAASACGSCPGRTICQNSQCTCNHQCDPVGKATCVGTNKYERCSIDQQGCRYWQAFTCPSGKSCKDGSCCASGCKVGQECGTNACGDSCGTCHARASCQQDKCVCNHQCNQTSRTECLSSKSYRVCQVDGRGCRYWSSALNCQGQSTCQNNTCCAIQCTNRECGADSCGGSCGACKYSCINNLCRRKITFTTISLPCDVCGDTLIGVDPDPYIKVTLSNGQSFQSKDLENACGSKVSFNWTISNLDPGLLKNALVEVYDYDSLNGDDLCASWRGDLSLTGTRSLKAGKSSYQVTVEK